LRLTKLRPKKSNRTKLTAAIAAKSLRTYKIIGLTTEQGEKSVKEQEQKLTSIFSCPGERSFAPAKA
jgi:predicted aconitase